jgi:hypothetical protein
MYCAFFDNPLLLGSEETPRRMGGHQNDLQYRNFLRRGSASRQLRKSFILADER